MDGQGHCTGLDTAEPLVDVARRRAQLGARPMSAFCADAQRHAFASENHDAVVSRFGVMFFDDPVAAFSNIRRALRPGGALICIAGRIPLTIPSWSFKNALQRLYSGRSLPPILSRLANSLLRTGKGCKTF
jgi:ubiquinone/menaquinone biosynthesis C-methylase UbiE